MRRRCVKNDLGQEGKTEHSRRTDALRSEESLKRLGVPFVRAHEDPPQVARIDVPREQSVVFRSKQRGAFGKPLDLGKEPIGVLPDEGRTFFPIIAGLARHHV